jgi:hypothetical protein
MGGAAMNNPKMYNRKFKCAYEPPLIEATTVTDLKEAGILRESNNQDDAALRSYHWGVFSNVGTMNY